MNNDGIMIRTKAPSLPVKIKSYITTFKVGDKVKKLSGKPFKSTFKVNTVSGFVLNKFTGKASLTFKEDDSDVEIFRCTLAQPRH